MLVQGNAAGGLWQHAGGPGLAVLDRPPAQILAVELEHVEGAELATRVLPVLIPPGTQNLIWINADLCGAYLA
jgi:hypothetical protein